MALVAADGKLHAIGGRFTSPVDRTGEHDVYDPATNSWTDAAPLPTPRSGLSYTLYKGLIMVLGGEFPPEDRTFNENEAFDVKANVWRTLAPMPAGRHATAAVTDGANVYLAGGSLKPGGGAPTNQLVVFNLP
jgi:N-acetylneuraminic acid mutarotase